RPASTYRCSTRSKRSKCRGTPRSAADSTPTRGSATARLRYRPSSVRAAPRDDGERRMMHESVAGAFVGPLATVSLGALCANALAQHRYPMRAISSLQLGVAPVDAGDFAATQPRAATARHREIAVRLRAVVHRQLVAGANRAPGRQRERIGLPHVRI